MPDSSWGDSWGDSWGNAWGDVTTTTGDLECWVAESWVDCWAPGSWGTTTPAVAFRPVFNMNSNKVGGWRIQQK